MGGRPLGQGWSRDAAWFFLSLVALGRRLCAGFARRYAELGKGGYAERMRCARGGAPREVARIMGEVSKDGRVRDGAEACFLALVTWARLLLVPRMPWLWLIVAGLLEISWAVGLKYTDGFSKLVPSVVTVVLMLASFWCLAQAVKGLPLGTSYAIWTGIGAVGTAIAGIVLFKEPATAARLACMVLIVAGIVGLKFTAR